MIIRHVVSQRFDQELPRPCVCQLIIASGGSLDGGVMSRRLKSCERAVQESIVCSQLELSKLLWRPRDVDHGRDNPVVIVLE